MRTVGPALSVDVPLDARGAPLDGGECGNLVPPTPGGYQVSDRHMGFIPHGGHQASLATQIAFEFLTQFFFADVLRLSFIFCDTRGTAESSAASLPRLRQLTKDTQQHAKRVLAT